MSNIIILYKLKLVHLLTSTHSKGSQNADDKLIFAACVREIEKFWKSGYDESIDMFVNGHFDFETKSITKFY